MNKNYYEEKLLEINKLINEDELVKAKRLLEEELNMPYIPMKYEENFNCLFQDIVVKLLDGRKGKKTIAIESILEMLYGSEQEQAMAIELISTHSLRPYSLEIKKRIESWSKKENIKKAFLFEVLAEQEINLDINFDGETFNTINNSILNNNQVKVALEIVDSLVLKEPHLKEVVKDQIKHYLLLIFPNILENGDLLSRQMVNIVKEMQGQSIILTKEEKEIKEILK